MTTNEKRQQRAEASRERWNKRRALTTLPRRVRGPVDSGLPRAAETGVSHHASSAAMSADVATGPPPSDDGEPLSLTTRVGRFAHALLTN
jgi:hypothetical protein